MQEVQERQEIFKIYGKENCSFCTKAKMLLDIKGIKYEYIDITKSDGVLEMFQEKGWKTVPQIFKDSEYIGGFTELKEKLS